LNESIAGFLIDECLSHELADLALEHGYHALAASRMWRLRKRDDYRVAKYALDHDLVLVPNDMYDLEGIYEQFEVHPGIVFITAGRPKLRTLPFQRRMFELMLEEIEDSDLYQRPFW
jgi:predicted nuclease of predicted toxin-antitoxin system